MQMTVASPDEQLIPGSSGWHPGRCQEDSSSESAMLSPVAPVRPPLSRDIMDTEGSPPAARRALLVSFFSRLRRLLSAFCSAVSCCLQMASNPCLLRSWCLVHDTEGLQPWQGQAAAHKVVVCAAVGTGIFGTSSDP